MPAPSSGAGLSAEQRSDQHSRDVPEADSQHCTERTKEVSVGRFAGLLEPLRRRLARSRMRNWITPIMLRMNMIVSVRLVPSVTRATAIAGVVETIQMMNHLPMSRRCFFCSQGVLGSSMYAPLRQCVVCQSQPRQIHYDRHGYLSKHRHYFVRWSTDGI